MFETSCPHQGWQTQFSLLFYPLLVDRKEYLPFTVASVQRECNSFSPNLNSAYQLHFSQQKITPSTHPRFTHQAIKKCSRQIIESLVSITCCTYRTISCNFQWSVCYTICQYSPWTLEPICSLMFYTESYFYRQFRLQKAPWLIFHLPRFQGTVPFY